jgi:hypothetical protein
MVSKLGQNSDFRIFWQFATHRILVDYDIFQNVKKANIKNLRGFIRVTNWISSFGQIPSPLMRGASFPTSTMASPGRLQTLRH